MSEHPLVNSKSEKNRLPPGQREEDDFPFLSKVSVPSLPDDWKIRIFGEVEEELALSLSDLKQRPEVISQIQDFHCVTGWSKLGVEWTGIRFRDLIGNTRPSEEIKHVMFHSLDGYTTNLPLRA